MSKISKKAKKTIFIILAIVAVVAVIFIVIFSLVKSKTLLINKYFITGSAVKGVDVSKFQGKIDFEKIKAQSMEFVYIKATEGSKYVDTEFKENWKKSKEAGIFSGAYHFFSFDSPGTNQANNYIDAVGDLDGRLVPAVDIEWYGDKKKNQPDYEDVVRELKDFLTTIENRYGVKPIIYAPKEIYVKYLKEEFPDYLRWVRSVFYPVAFEAGDNWTIWQYCDRGMLEGYEGQEKYIDLNVIKDRESFERLLVK